MDNLSHSRHPKVITNGGGGFLAKTLYDDVYGGPPKFGLSSSSSLSPRLEDYGEIFGAFHASRASSIPVLELPVAADDDNDEFFDVISSGFDYSEVFGGFDGLDFAVAYDDLVNQPNGRDGGSSDEAWTPAGSRSVSGESNHSVKNQSFSDGDPYYSFDASSEFGMAYNKAHKKTNKESLNGKTHQVPAAPGYRYMPDEITPVQQTKFDNQMLVTDDRKFDNQMLVTDDRKFNMYSNVESGNEKHLRKTASLPPNGSSAGQGYGDNHKTERGYGRNGSRHKEPFVTILDISLRTQLSHLPPPCRPPPIVDGNSGDSGRLSSNSNTVSSDERTGDCSPPFFDVEVDASSSAAVSAAAMKEAMEKARVQLRSAKELLQRKKEGYHSRPKSRSKKERKEEEGKLDKVADGSGIKKYDRVWGTSEREDSRMKFTVSEETQKVLKKVREDRESLGGENSSEAANLGQDKCENGSWSSQGSSKIDEASEWQEATQYFELVTIDETKKAFQQANKEKILVQSTKGHEHRQKDKATLEVLEQQEIDKKVRAFIDVHDPEDLEKKCRGLEEGNARSKDAKESRRRKEHEKNVKVTQEAFEKGENEMSSRMSKLPTESDKQRGRSEKHDNMSEVQGKENKFNVENAMHPKDNEVKSQENDKAVRIEEGHKESCGREGIQKRQEALEQEENERRLIEAFEQATNEERLKEVREKERNEKRSQEALEQAENEKRLKKALELQEKEKRLKEALKRENNKRQKEAAQREDNEKRLNEVLEKEENEKWLKEENAKKLKKALELQENEKKLKEAHERENKRRQKEAAQREENEKRLKEALELEEYQRRQKEAHDREENERRLKMAHAREQQYAIERLKESQERAFKQAEIQQKLDEASLSEKSEKNIEVIDEREEVQVLNKMQKGTERNEDVQEFRSFKGTQLVMEVGDHKVPDKTCSQDRDENSQVAQIARNHDENCERMKDSQEGPAHEQNGEKRTNKKNSDTQSGPEVVEPVNVSPDIEYKVSALSQEDLENGEKRFRRKDANESLPLDAIVKKAREEIRAQPQVRKTELGGVEMKNGLVDKNFKASGLSGLAQGGTESVNSQDDSYESIPFVHFVKKAVEASSGIEKPQPNINSTSEKDSVQETQKMECAQEWKEQEKDSKQVHASSNQEENLAAEPRRKTAHPAMAEVNNRKLSQQVNASQAPERKAKDLKEETSNGQKETEQLKRERELENYRLRKIEEEREREREREKDRMAVDRATLEARDWAYVEAHERTERVALEARQRAMAEARERLEKACAEAREKSLAGKAAMEARLKMERAAVERANAEARERAAERLMAERASCEARERVQRSVSDKFSASSRNNRLRHCSSSSDLQDPQKSRDPYSTAYGERYGVEGESAQRCKARLERHARTAERAAKALAEKNMRDLLAQREQAERNRLSDTLDADVKRWSSGKEGNLRALLSTLQYILGPDSGWQPIPLTEVITAGAVKKAYRKATLYVHPDKLQQRGATIHQKYICEKVFDLLKEAWNKFNSEER